MLKYKSNGWKITNIFTPTTTNNYNQLTTFFPTSTAFIFKDPEGVTSKELNVVLAGDIHSDDISFLGLGTDTINKGLAFFEKLAMYRNWRDYFNSETSPMITTLSLLAEKSKQLAESKRLEFLEIENKELKEKIRMISSIIST